jgi:hypothetical protein
VSWRRRSTGAHTSSVRGLLWCARGEGAGGWRGRSCWAPGYMEKASCKKRGPRCPRDNRKTLPILKSCCGARRVVFDWSAALPARRCPIRRVLVSRLRWRMRLTVADRCGGGARSSSEAGAARRGCG